jgi:hypothetical protein
MEVVKNQIWMKYRNGLKKKKDEADQRKKYLIYGNKFEHVASKVCRKNR